ncbi:gluconokinase [Paraglaciecola polaris]|uniref:Gluconokinase n=2 Tax=Paraglaciecola polaris TaxID=222814 RepID=K7A2S4_9ALTE|nr:gluconokinase [Paraglaciecola polaris]GAC35213.1 gluconokinase [Paraglaciecola polaris LMG 21857]|tara:strand:+ start:12113 stop:12601 length:489 start_codon:yes stop_codon:yes gene_type:complete
MILIVCGVSGTGKSTIGNMLAEKLSLPFYDADDFHPQSNVQKMQNGTPLNDEDRQPWLETLSDKLASWENEGGAVLACSALKAAYRDTLASKCTSNIEWIILHGSKALLTERLGARKGHFFEPRLLDSQLSTLELPNDAVVVDIQPPPEDIVQSIVARLHTF